MRDPYCAAYKQTFDKIIQRVTVEMASEENIEAVAARPYDGKGHPLLKKGPLIELVREGPHPSKIARTAKRIVAAVELARGPDIPAVAARLVEDGHLPHAAVGRGFPGCTSARLAAQAGLAQQPLPACDLRLPASLHPLLCPRRRYGRLRGQMEVDEVLSLVRQAKEAGFRQVIITGGEPLVHTQREQLLDWLCEPSSGGGSCAAEARPPHQLRHAAGRGFAAGRRLSL